MSRCGTQIRSLRDATLVLAVVLSFVPVVRRSDAAALPEVPILRDGSSPIAVVDVNGDGVADLVVAKREGVAVYVAGKEGALPPDPTKVLPLGVPLPSVDASSGRRAIAVADLNNDGKPDIVVTDTASGAVYVLIGQGEATFLAPTTIATLSIPTAVAIADFDRDGRPDLAVVSKGTNKVFVFRGTGGARFEPHGEFVAGFEPTSILVGDFGTDEAKSEHDGNLDIGVSATGEGQIAVLFGDGRGGFSAPAKFVSGSATALAGADVNSDGTLDLVTANSTQHAVSINLGYSKGTHGSFGGQSVVATFDPTVQPRGIAVADLNGDGKADLAVAAEAATADQSGVYVFLNRAVPRTGFLIFDKPTFCSAGSAPAAIVVADLRTAGPHDLVVVDKNSGQLSRLRGDGAGGFANCDRPTQRSELAGGVTAAADRSTEH